MEFILPGQVKECGSVPQGVGAKNTMAAVMFIRAETCNLLMTGSAGMKAVYGELAIIKKFSTQCYTFCAKRVVAELVYWRWKSVWNLQVDKREIVRVIILTA